MTGFNLWALALALLLCSARPAQAAESYDNCAGFITSLPAAITTQGTWCLKQDLNTALTSGSAISINTNNVTLDCNNFKLGGLLAGPNSTTVGVYTFNGRQNIVVRNCSIRGFYSGIKLSDGSGHIVEDNRLDNNLSYGIYVGGDSNLVQRNRVSDTGGTPNSFTSWGIYAAADVIDNTVSGVFATAPDATAIGIHMLDDGTEARGNRVRGLVMAGSGVVEGIVVGAQGVRVGNNHISATVLTSGYGIRGQDVSSTFCTGNTIGHITLPISDCLDVGGNASN